MAVLLVLLPAALLWLISADQSLLHITDRLDGLLLALVTDLPGLLLAVLGVAVLLGLLGASLLLQLADLLWLKVAVLLLHREGEDVGEFLAISVNISLAHLYLDLLGRKVENKNFLKLSNELPFLGCCSIPLAYILHYYTL